MAKQAKPFTAAEQEKARKAFLEENSLPENTSFTPHNPHGEFSKPSDAEQAKHDELHKQAAAQLGYMPDAGEPPTS